MTDTSLADVATAARHEHQGVVERIDALRKERVRLASALKEAVTREAYLRRVISAADPKPRTRKSKASENGESQ